MNELNTLINELKNQQSKHKKRGILKYTPPPN